MQTIEEIEALNAAELAMKYGFTNTSQAILEMLKNGYFAPNQHKAQLMKSNVGKEQIDPSVTEAQQPFVT